MPENKVEAGHMFNIAVIGSLLLEIGLFWLMGSKIQAQVAQLSDTLPVTIENAKSQLSQNPIGKKLVEKANAPETIKRAKELANTFFKTTFGVFGDIYVVLFLGIFFTVSPDVYKKGIVQLIPKKGQKKGEDIVNKLGSNLKKWLKGKFAGTLFETHDIA